MSLIRRAATLALILFASASATAAGQTALVDSAMALNRAGLWKEAGELSVKGSRETASPDERCGLMFSSIYALIRLGDLDAGREEIKTYDDQCAPLPAMNRYANALQILRVEGSMPPVPVTGLDFSGVDRFWKIVDTLDRGINPSSHLWRSMLATPAYRMALRTDDDLQDKIDVAFRPSRRAERDSIVHSSGPESTIVAHLVAVGEQRASLEAKQAALSMELPDTIQAAARNAARFLPEHILEHKAPPLVTFAFFGDERLVEHEGVAFDLLAVPDTNLTAFLSRLFEKLYIDGMVREAAPADRSDLLLYQAIRNLRNEGIADMVGTQYPLQASWPVTAEHAAEYNAAYARTPQVIRSLDSLLAFAFEHPDQRAIVGDHVQQLLTDGSRPNGAYMAREVLDVLGHDSLAASVFNPFVFVRMYRAAEKKRGHPAPFSPKAIAMLDLMEKRWMR